jgi:hypothetical protein
MSADLEMEEARVSRKMVENKKVGREGLVVGELEL